MALIANACGARYCTVGTVNGRECSRLHGVDLTVNADIGSARRHVRSQERSGRPEGTAESVRATGRACSAVAPLGPTWRIGLAWYARAGRSRSARANRGQGVCAADYQAPVLGRDSECPRGCWFGLPGCQRMYSTAVAVYVRGSGWRVRGRVLGFSLLGTCCTGR